MFAGRGSRVEQKKPRWAGVVIGDESFANFSSIPAHWLGERSGAPARVITCTEQNRSCAITDFRQRR
jgi:hypothetical protein